MRPRSLVLAAALAAAAAPAAAAPQAFNSVIDWFIAAGGVDPLFAPLTDSNPLPPGTTDVGPFSITIDRTGTEPVRVEGGIFFGDIDGSDNETSEIEFSAFDQPIIGFGGSFETTLTGDLLTATLNGTTFRFSTLLSEPGDGFVGFLDLAGITSLRFGVEELTTTGEFFRLTSVFLMSAPAATPAPAAFALLGLGVGALASARRQRG